MKGVNYKFFNKEEFKYLTRNLDKHIELYKSSLKHNDIKLIEHHLKVIYELSGEITDWIVNYK